MVRSFPGWFIPPTAKMLAACAYDEIIRLWDTSTGKQVRQFQGQEQGVRSLAISPDGKLLAAAGFGEVKIWRLDVSSNKEFPLPGTKAGAGALAFSRDGKQLAVATKDQGIRIWEVGPWRETRRLAGHGNQFCVGLAFFPDNKTLVSAAQDESVRLWDVATGKQLSPFVHRGFKGIWTMALSPDGKRLAVVERSNALSLFDAAKGKLLSLLTHSEDWYYCIAFSSDSRTVAASGGRDRSVRFLDATTGVERRRWTSSEFATRLAFSPDGKVLAVGGSGMVRFRDADTGKDLLPPPCFPEDVTTVTFAGDGKTLVGSGAGGFVGFWDPATGKELSPLHSPPSGFHPPPRRHIPSLLSREGTRVAGVDAKWGVQIWESATGKKLSRVGLSDTYTLAALSPDGKTVAVAHEDRIIRLWDAETGKRIRQFADLKGKESPQIPVFSADGKVLATTYSNGIIRIWETATGRQLQRFQGGMISPQCLAFSPDGKVLACGHSGMLEKELQARNGIPEQKEDTHLRLWDVASGREMRRFKVISPLINSIAFAPDGRTLATAIGSTAQLWEVASGLKRGRFHGHRSGIGGLAFSPDGRMLATGSGDRTVVVWDVTGLLQRTKGEANLSSNQVEKSWADLASADGARAYQAVWKLSNAGRQAVPFLRARLRPVAGVDQERLTRLLAKLDSKQFSEREKATQELEKLGELAEPKLGKALKDPGSLELHRRLEKIVQKLNGPITSSAQLQSLRSVEVLEHIGAPDARQVLETLSKGAPAARLTREARGSLQRLAGHSSTRP